MASLGLLPQKLTNTKTIRTFDMYKTVYTEVEVDVDLGDFDTDDLVEELESRGAGPVESGDANELLQAIWLKRRVGRTDYQTELDQLIYAGLGKIV
jgi:hypothetical protein